MYSLRWFSASMLACVLAMPALAGINDVRMTELQPSSGTNGRIEIWHNSPTPYTLTANEDIWICHNTLYEQVVAASTTLQANERRVITLTGSPLSSTSADAWLFKNIQNNTGNFGDSSRIIAGVQYGTTSGARTGQAVSVGVWSNTSEAAPVPGSGQSLAWDGDGNLGSDWYIDATPSLGSADPVSGGSVQSSLQWSSSTQNFEGLALGDYITTLSNWVVVDTSTAGKFQIRSTSSAAGSSGTSAPSSTKWIRVVDSDATNVQNRFYSPTLNAGTNPTSYSWTFYVQVESPPSASAATFPRLTIQHNHSTLGMSNAWGVEVRNNAFHLVRTGIGGSESTSSMGSMSANTWYRISLSVNFSTNQIVGRVNGGAATTLAMTLDPQADPKLFRFCYRGEGTGNTATMLLDDISISPVFPVDAQITSSAPTTAQAGFLYSYTVTATGTPAPTLTASGLPGWLTFNSTSGVLSGTPSNNDVGPTPSITITASNGIGSDDTEVFLINVASSNAPSITGTPGTKAVSGFAYSYTFNVSGTPAPTVQVAGLPAWASFNAGTRTISGTPAGGDVGITANIAITATNGITPNASQNFALEVLAPVAPAISSTPGTLAYVGNAFSYVVAASGEPAPTVTVQNLPGWLNYNAGTRTISGTPQSGNVGVTGQISVTASNGVAPDATQNFTIDVQTPAAPVITSSAATTVLEGQLYSYPIIVTGNPAPTVNVQGLPSWLSYSAATMTISGTPSAANAGTTGTISITATNGFAPDDSESFQITVTALAAPQITSSAPTSAAVNNAYTYAMIVTGAPEPNVSVQGLPAWLTFNAGTKTISGTPQASDAGPTGQITITASNGVGSDAVQNYVINVANPLPPQITSSAPTTARTDELYTYTIVSTGNPAPTVTVSGLPAWLSYNGVSQTVSGTPGDTISGMTGIITVTAANGVAPNDTQTFQIDVELRISPIITSIPAVTALVGQPYSYTVVVTGTPTPTINVASLPGWLSYNAATRVISGTPGAGDAGTADQVVIFAGNGVGNDAQQLFMVMVEDGTAPVITSSPAATATVGQLYAYAITATGDPVPTITVAGLPAWLSFDSASGVIRGTPGSSDVGITNTITITASNGIPPNALQTLTIGVQTSGGGGGGPVTPPASSGGGGGGGCSLQCQVGTTNWAALLATLAVLALVMARRRRLMS